MSALACGHNCLLYHVFPQGGQKEKREERQGEGERKREERSHKRESAEEETDNVTHHHDPEIQARDQVWSANPDTNCLYQLDLFSL